VYIILLGAPGAGKGTQAVYVAQKLNLVHIATGDLFRQAIEQGTELGMQAKSYMERGCLLYTSPSPRDQRGSRMPSSA